MQTTGGLSINNGIQANGISVVFSLHKFFVSADLNVNKNSTTTVEDMKRLAFLFIACLLVLLACDKK